MSFRDYLVYGTTTPNMRLHRSITVAILVWLGVNGGQSYDFDLRPPPPSPTNFSVPRPNEPKSVPDYVSSANRDRHGRFLAAVMNIILETAIFYNDERQGSPYKWYGPDELKKHFDFSLGEAGLDHALLLEVVRDVIKLSPIPSHPFMLDKRVAGLDPYALLGDWVATTMSNNVAAYVTAPIWTLMEIDITKQLGNKISWGNPEGIPTSGAGVANSLAMAMALQDKYTGLNQGGFAAHGYPSPIVFISEDASYAFRKAALYQGLRHDSIVKIKVNRHNGQMDIASLKSRIQEYQNPAYNFDLVAVVATIGTPLLGAIDPIDEIANICAEHNMWLHVDAEKGAGIFFGADDRMHNLRKHISQANSVTFGTWAFAIPYVTTFLITKESDRIQRSFGLNKPNIFTQRSLYNGSYDMGDHTIQASRRPEVAKLWYSWKARGNARYASLVALQYKNLDIFTSMVKNDTAFKLVQDKFEIPQVAFWWVPSAYRELDWLGLHLWQEIFTATQLIKKHLVQNEVMQVTLAPGNYLRPDFLVVSLTNTVLTKGDFQYILDAINKYGALTESTHNNLSMPGLPLCSHKYIWGTSPIRQLHGKLYEDKFQLFLKEGMFFTRNDYPSQFEPPERLIKLVDLKLEERSATHNELHNITRQIINYSPHTGHPYFLYQLTAGLDPYTIAADYIASALNTPMLTFEDSPVFTLMENEVLAVFRKRVFGTTQGDGVITDGGSMANQLAIALARHRINTNVKLGGIEAAKKRFVVYLSEDGHYSAKKGAILQGLGGNNTIEIDANYIAQMDVKRLEEKVREGKADPDMEPIMVIITVGTAIYGGIDKVDEIINVCEKYNLWCHVDGMFGGFMIMSDQHKDRLKGVERADSFSADLHKMMGSTYVMTVLVTRQSNVFKSTFSTDDPLEFYSWVPNPLYNKLVHDLGDNYWQVDKRNNMFKFWFLWKAKGRIGMRDHIDKIIQNTAYLVNQLHYRQGFQPMIDDFEVTSVCFLYIPPILQDMDQSSQEFRDQIGFVSFQIVRALTQAGVLNIVAQNRHSSHGDTVPFLTFVMSSSALDAADIDYLLDVVEHYGNSVLQVTKSTVNARLG